MSITLGNSKIGKKFTWTWSIPPGLNGTCPGESSECGPNCYAKKGFLGCAPAVVKTQKINYEMSKTPYFADWMTLEIKKAKAKLFRIHVAGDFYDIEYTKKWLKIVQECRETTFYAYTRSWCIDEIRPWLNKLAEKTNFRMWFSCDRSMKEPFRSKNVRLAYMQVEKE